MARLSIDTFGSFYVTVDGRPVTTFESNKVRALLVYLAAEAERPHSRDSLVGLLWPDQPERTARRNLSQALFNLRQAIGDDQIAPPFLDISRGTVQFRPESDYWLDCGAFSTHAGAYKAHAHREQRPCDTCVGLLEEMDALYRGEFLAGFYVADSSSFGEWAMLRRERFHRQVLDAQYTLARHFERRRDYERARGYAERQVQLEPWREEAHRQLMALLAKTGQRSAALAQYELCRTTLAEELGVDPEQETRALYERIRAAGSAPRHNLPAQATPFVGREEELAAVAERLANPQCRLLTLVGPGGIGKTRLALRAAEEAMGAFLHGATLIPLGPVSSIEFLPSAVANALGLQLQAGRPPGEQLADWMRDKELLLVMDGFEHLPAGALFVADLLKNAPHVKIVVTSREPLSLQAEWLLDVEGLACPPDDATEPAEGFSAVQLFAQHAGQVRAGFTLALALDKENWPHVARICRMLDGVPLGIKLASAWVRTLSCAQIADEVQRDLDFLTTSLRDVQAEHKSLRAVFQRSWALLSEEERRAAARLSVFRGSFSFEAARAVAEAAKSTLASLVAKSLVGHHRAEEYDLHMLVRQYAAEELAASFDREPSQDRHARYYASLLQARENPLKGKGQSQARAEIGAAIADIRAAWQWAAAQRRIDVLEPALDGLYLFYRAQGQAVEGGELLGQAAEAIADAAAAPGRLLLARIWARQADFHSSLGEYDLARSRLQASVEALQTLDSPQEMALSLAILGRMEYRLSELPEALAHLQASVDAYRETGDRWGLAQALSDLANVLCCDCDQHGQAKTYYEESLSLAQEIGDQPGIARALLNMGHIEYGEDRLTEAESLYQRSVAISRAAGDRRILAIALSSLGHLAYRSQAYERAEKLLRDSVDIKREIGDRYSTFHSLMYLGNIGLKTGQVEEARQWYEQAARLASETGSAHLMVCSVICAARLRMTVGNLAEAVELLQVALNNTAAYRELTDEIGGYLADLKKQVPHDVMVAMRRRGDARSLSEVFSKLLAGGLSASLE